MRPPCGAARLSEKLLQLAKAEGGGLLAETPAPLGLVLRHVIEEIYRLTDRGDALAVSITPDDGPLSDLDPDAFAILARNLIENALKHGAPDAPVSVRLAEGLFEVSNHGAVVPAEQLERLVRPFERGPTRSEDRALALRSPPPSAAARASRSTSPRRSPAQPMACAPQCASPRHRRKPDGKLNANQLFLQAAVRRDGDNSPVNATGDIP
ncbi:hypothetical protein RZS28_19105 (plasmid) [Methylocapsa polymorpha]|uniref:histidine kinase n=1 Tax=Methylocapsa polymorpha TaxID=3080828 RepID=A0ABZ0HZJ9_9HYPH|nr:ATP-binding protein [Methylocapsa sp. RX1]WOJ91834.1 hypothetical protein RZS28_19105 [Methylocapsa sp. RX1]